MRTAIEVQKCPQRDTAQKSSITDDQNRDTFGKWFINLECLHEELYKILTQI